MDTKWKNYRYSNWLKLMAIILCIAGMLTMAYGCLKVENFENALENQSFKESSTGTRILSDLYSDVYRAAFDYRSIENLETGAGVSEDEVSQENRQIFDERHQRIQEINEQYASWLEAAKANESNAEVDRLEKERDERIAQANLSYDEKLTQVRSQLIENRKKAYAQLLKDLNQTDGLYYTVLLTDGTMFSNKTDILSADKFYTGLPLYKAINSSESMGLYVSELPPEGSTVFVGMAPERFNQEQKSFEAGRQQGRIGIYQLLSGALLFLAGVMYLIYAAGRRPESGEVALIWLDKPYLDIELAVVVPLIVVQAIAVYQLGESLYPLNLELFFVLACSLIILATLMGIAAGTSIVKRIKRRELFKHTLIGAVFIWAFGHPKKLAAALQNELKKGPLAVRTAMLFALYASAVFITIVFTVVLGAGGFFGVLLGGALFLAVNFAALVFVLKKVSAVTAITTGTERIRAGELNFRIAKTGEPVTDALAENINTVAEGLKASVENEVKAERLKAELVTNVSHDLKTPLTSIITYIDLLKTEGICSENAPKYLEVLDNKSQRLKSLTEDLFEAAKASSGTMAFTLEKLDITDLISQGLGELSDRIQESGLELKVSTPAEKVYARGDGKLLWRVMENLLSNVFKYAQPGSRVYIDTVRSNGSILVTLKNISAFELNIHADELMERFKRGDESRHSEGSGLGLSIARSLTELQGGSFNIAIDGDLFKATVAMPEFGN